MSPFFVSWKSKNDSRNAAKNAKEVDQTSPVTFSRPRGGAPARWPRRRLTATPLSDVDGSSSRTVESARQPTPGGPSSRIADAGLLGPIAAGSYGEVWLARNAVGTLRAVEIVRRDRFERAEDFEREFKGLQRFEPISRSHEGLMDILQIGRRDDEGWFYYLMELADAVERQKADGESAPLPFPQSLFFLRPCPPTPR